MRYTDTSRECRRKAISSRFLLISIILCCSIVSCATQYERTYNGPLKLIEEASLIYHPFPRLYYGGSMNIIKIDGRKSSKFRHDFYPCGLIELEPGKHELVSSYSYYHAFWGEYHGEITFETRLEPGRIYETEVELVFLPRYEQAVICRLTDITDSKKGRKAKRSWRANRE